VLPSLSFIIHQSIIHYPPIPLVHYQFTLISLFSTSDFLTLPLLSPLHPDMSRGRFHTASSRLWRIACPTLNLAANFVLITSPDKESSIAIPDPNARSFLDRKSQRHRHHVVAPLKITPVDWSWSHGTGTGHQVLNKPPNFHVTQSPKAQSKDDDEDLSHNSHQSLDQDDGLALLAGCFESDDLESDDLEENRFFLPPQPKRVLQSPSLSPGVPQNHELPLVTQNPILNFGPEVFPPKDLIEKFDEADIVSAEIFILEGDLEEQRLKAQFQQRNREAQLNARQSIVESAISSSKSCRRNTSLNQFDKFLLIYCGERRPNKHIIDARSMVIAGKKKGPILRQDHSIVLTGTDPNNEVDYNPNAISMQELGIIMPSFINYLAKSCFVNNSRKTENDHIAIGTACNYLSDIKMYILETNSHMGESDFNVFDPSKWRALRKSMFTVMARRHRKLGTPIVNGHKPIPDSDRRSMALACIWMGNAEAAEFLHLNNSTFHMAGRGSECSLSKMSDISTKTSINGLSETTHLSVRLQRHKDGPEQDVAIYPHKTNFYECYLFSLGYLALFSAASNNASQYIFPNYSQKALLEDNHGRNKSKVASLWTDHFKRLLVFMEELKQKLSSLYTSHSGKKSSSQKMAETPSVSGLAQIFRTGWEVRGFHSLFDYVVGTVTMAQQAGKALAGWTSQNGNHVPGGYAPSLLDIQTEPEKAPVFSALLFGSLEGLEACAKSTLTATMIRFYGDFCSAVQQHPDYKNQPEHYLVQTIKRHLATANVSEATFQKWQEEINGGFRRKNIAALPLHCLSDAEKSHVSVDIRSFTDGFNHLQQFCQDSQGATCYN